MGNGTAAEQTLPEGTENAPAYRYDVVLKPIPTLSLSISCILTYLLGIISVVCDYMLTKMLALPLFAGPHPSQLRADPGFGELHVRMRLARGRFLEFTPVALKYKSNEQVTFCKKK